MGSQDDLQFGRSAVRLGMVEPRQLASCLQLQKELRKKGQTVHLSQIFLKRGLLNSYQIDAVMRTSVKEMALEKTNMRTPAQDFPKTKIKTVKKLEKYLGRYEIQKEIGRGGMGRVYKAHDCQLDRSVALKRLIADDDEESIARFLREAKATAKLDHSNIVKVYELGQEEGQYFFIMDYVEGFSLHEIAQKSTLTIRQITDIMIKIGNAVEYAHEQGIIHRDLKPGNVMIGSDNEPKVMDFGLAKITGENSKLSQSGVMLGTLQYMPPEQAEGRIRSIDKTSDVYSLGAILYEMLTGKPPFSGNTFSHVLDQVLHKEPTPPTEIKRRVPKSLEIICLKALQKDKQKRYQSARELTEDLNNFSKGKKIKATRTVGKGKIGQVMKNKKIVAIAVLLLLVLIIAVVGGNGSKKRKGKKNKTHKQTSLRNKGKQESSDENKTSVLTMSVKAVDYDKKEKHTFTHQERIQAEINWEMQGVSENATVEVEIYGERVNTFKMSASASEKKLYCPLKVFDSSSGKIEATVQITIGKATSRETLSFKVQAKKMVVEATINAIVNIVNKNHALQDVFVPGEKIFLKTSLLVKNLPAGKKIKLTLRGKGIKGRRYTLPNRNDIFYFLITVLDKDQRKYSVTAELSFGGEMLSKRTLDFWIGSKPQTNVDFDILELGLYGPDNSRCKSVRFGQKAYILLKWKVNKAPMHTRQLIEIFGKGVDYTKETYQKVAQPNQVNILKFPFLLEASPKSGRKEIDMTVRVFLGNEFKEKSLKFEIVK